MDQDSKIRQYVMKKQQQKERANFLRQQRRNQKGTDQPTSYGGGSRNSFAQNTRKVADPFAGVNNENDNSNVNAINPPWNSDSQPAYDRQFDDGNKFESNNNRGQYRGGGGYPNNGGGGYQNNGSNDMSNDMGNDPEYNDYDGANDGGNCGGGNNWQSHSTPMAKPNRGNGQFTNQSHLNRNARGHRPGGGNNNNMGRNTQRRGQSVNVRSTANQRTTNKRAPNRGPQQFNNRPMDPPENRFGRSQSQSQSQSHSISENVQYATADDVKKVLSMVEQLKGQMHGLQFQLDNVKLENRKLQQTIDDISKQQQEAAIMPPPSNQQQNDMGPPPKARFSDNGHSQRQRMDRGGRNRAMDIDNEMSRHGGGHNNGHGGNNGNGSMRMSQSLRKLKQQQQQMSPGGNPNGNDYGGNGGGFGGGAHGQRRGGNDGGFDGGNDRSNNDQQNERQQRFGGGRGDQNSGRFGFNSRGNSGQHSGGRNGYEMGGGNGNGMGGGNGNNYNGRMGGGNGGMGGGGGGMGGGSGGMGGGGGGGFPGHRDNGAAGGGHRGGNMGDDDEAEVQAPPPSSAEDLIAKLEEQSAQFGGLEQTVERVQCHQCGRKFSQSALTRHMKICKKVFGQKRKAFNMKQQRADDEMLKAQSTTNPEIERELKRKKEAAKKKWKAQSAMLRNAVRSSKQIDQAMKNGVPLSDLPQMPSIPVEDTRIPCPHCGRKFAEETAKRHIPKCQNIKSRPKALKRRMR